MQSNTPAPPSTTTGASDVPPSTTSTTPTSNKKRSKRNQKIAPTEHEPLLTIDTANLDQLDPRYSYHIDINTRQVVVQGAIDLLEQPYKRKYYLAIGISCLIVMLLTIASATVLVVSIVLWELPDRVILIAMLALMLVGTLSCMITTWIALTVIREARDNIMHLRHNKQWYVEAVNHTLLLILLLLLLLFLLLLLILMIGMFAIGLSPIIAVRVQESVWLPVGNILPRLLIYHSRQFLCRSHWRSGL
jgi:hypothetical protein